MKDDKLDSMIHETLLQGTDKAAEMKDTVWKNIETSVRHTGKRSKHSTSSNYRRLAMGLVSTAAAVAVIFFAGTTPGQAAVKKVADFLLPQKEIVQELEGNKEKAIVELNTSKIGYAMYIDKETYKLEQLEGRDKITPIYISEAKLPEVYMEIRHLPATESAGLAAQLEQELKDKGFEIRNSAEVTDPIAGTEIRAVNGNAWDSTVIQHYIVNDGKDGVFLITEQYFMEASEGHGARFYHMLKDFHITEENEK